jgi:hypothetical protein
MARQKRKRTAAERAARRQRQRETVVVFLHGKQKRIPRPPTIDGIPVDEFILRNADPLWLHQNEMWELIDQAAALESIDEDPPR